MSKKDEILNEGIKESLHSTTEEKKDHVNEKKEKSCDTGKYCSETPSIVSKTQKEKPKKYVSIYINHELYTAIVNKAKKEKTSNAGVVIAIVEKFFKGELTLVDSKND